MEIKEIKGIAHKLYDDVDEFKAFCPNEEIVGTWREGQVCDWILTDDDYVCQILGKAKLNHPGYKKLRTMVRTVCGSFIVEQKTHTMLGEHGVAENIYAFSGNYDAIYSRQKDRKLNNREFLFARYVAAGDNVLNAYKKAYPKARDEGISPEWIVAKYKDIADLSDRDTDKLRSLEALAKMAGLFDTEKKQEQLTVFTGFTPEQMEAISGGKGTKLVAHKEKKDKD